MYVFFDTETSSQTTFLCPVSVVMQSKRYAEYRKNFELAEQQVAAQHDVRHEVVEAQLGIGRRKPAKVQDDYSSHFDTVYRRRHRVSDDPVAMAKKKLEAACYGYGRDWAKLFGALDIDGSGSLDYEEFRSGQVAMIYLRSDERLTVLKLSSECCAHTLGLRRVARVPRSQLSDADIRQLFHAIDSSNNGHMETLEFVEFMITVLQAAFL